MNLGKEILFFISILGAFNGFVLSLYLLFSKKRKSIAICLLAALLLVISIRVSNTVLVFFRLHVSPLFLQIGMSACFLIGPALYFFLKAVKTKATIVPTAWKWHWAILLGIVLIGGTLAPYQAFPYIWDHVILYLIDLQWFIYLIATSLLIKEDLKLLFTNRHSLKGPERFGLVVYGGNFIILLFYVLSMSRLMHGFCVNGAISFSLILYLTICFYIYNARIENILRDVQADASQKPERKKIAATHVTAWREKLEEAISARQLYKDPNLKLNDVAQAIHVPPHQLSQLLNDNLGKSFSTYINEYRINEACKLITTNDRLTFEAIGYEVGYNSKSTFYAAFKKITDTTPALFKDKIAS